MGAVEELSIQRSYFDVLGICCPSEVPLIEKILLPLKGVQKVTVVVTSRTVIVVHDTTLITQLDIVDALNKARLEATVRAYGANVVIKKWPSPFILICGIFLLLSLFHRFFRPLRWLALVAVCVGLYPIILRSIASIRRYTLDINILMLIAVAGAIALRDYSEAGFIIFLFTIAEWLESRASSKATAGMSALVSMAPQKAILAETGHVVDAQAVQVNTLLAVKAGGVIPIDGVVVEGRSEVNEQSLTGESFPVAKQAQSLVWAGTLNIDGYIVVKTTALAEDSAVARMAKLVEEAQSSRSKTQRLIDSCTKYYTPAVVVIAAGVAVIPVILRVHNTRYWMQLALVLLVSACPCALVLSTPVATFCALLTAAKTGLLVKGGDVLEALARTRIVAFDKTGTITKGEFTVIDFFPIGCQVTLETLLYWVSSIESKSSHPMASALVDHAQSNSIRPKPETVNEFEIYPGEGVCGVIDGKKIYIGNKRIATRVGCQKVPSMESMKEGVTLGYVFLGTEPIGIFTLNDTCRAGVADAIRELRSLGVKSLMLTGDSTAAAMHAQSQLGNVLEELHAELLPEDKVRIINSFKAKEGPTAMVGDGMNDAPALAAADVGISMGVSGSAVAMETSHITMMSNDILKIPKAIRLARRTRRKIIVNILFSVVTKGAILALALAGHPLLWAAVLADVGTCLLVILNSMTLLKTTPPKANDKCRRSCHALDDQRHEHTNHCDKSNSGKADREPCCRAARCGEDCGSGVHERPNQMGDAREENVQKSCESGCCSRATNAKDEHVVVIGCRAEHHGDGGDKDANKELVVARENEEIGGCCKTEKKQCAKRDCHSSSSQVSVGENNETSSCCQSGKECRKRDLGSSSSQANLVENKERSCSSACCNGAMNAKDEHVVVITRMAEHHNKDVNKKCNGAQEKEEIGGCCKTETKDCRKRDSCSSSSQLGFGEKEITSCCKGEIKEYCQGGAEEEIVSCCSADHECSGNVRMENMEASCGSPKKENGGCCEGVGTRAKECGDMGGCSSARWGAERREIGGCCKSYRKKCEQRGRCCGGVVHLPEIITD